MTCYRVEYIREGVGCVVEDHGTVFTFKNLLALVGLLRLGHFFLNNSTIFFLPSHNLLFILWWQQQRKYFMAIRRRLMLDENRLDYHQQHQQHDQWYLGGDEHSVVGTMGLFKISFHHGPRIVIERSVILQQQISSMFFFFVEQLAT